MNRKNVRTSESPKLYSAIPAIISAIHAARAAEEASKASLSVVPSADADELARAVESFIQNPARRKAMGIAAQQLAREKFSAEIIVSQYEALYRRV